jgi:AcrR family transcriptional regulator
MDTAIPRVTRREHGKAERRRRIVEAAAALLRESFVDTVSMTEIATRADVSPATVYNLFETKGAILQQAFDLDLQDYRRAVAEAPARDAVDRIFVALDVAAARIAAHPVFHRAVALGGHGIAGLRSAISEPRTLFWRDRVADAVADGGLRRGTDPLVLSVMLAQLMRGAFQEWAAGIISVERMAQETAYGVATLLLPHADEATVRRLKRRLRAIEPALKQPRWNTGGRGETA